MAKIKQTAITKSARGQDCQIRLPFVCTQNPETVMWCHANGLASGKGIGKKSHDALGAYGCIACHDALEGRKHYDHLTRDEIKLAFHEAHQRSFLILIDKGLVKI